MNPRAFSTDTALQVSNTLIQATLLKPHNFFESRRQPRIQTGTLDKPWNGGTPYTKQLSLLCDHALFLSTLLPAGGASSIFFLAALTPTLVSFFFCAAAVVAAGAFLPLFTTVVAFEVVEIVLWLLTVRISGIGGGASTPRLGRVDVGLVIADVGLIGFRPVAPLPRVGFGFSATASAICVVAAIAADFAVDTGLLGENNFEGLINLSGDAGCERNCFWGEPRTGRTGD